MGVLKWSAYKLFCDPFPFSQFHTGCTDDTLACSCVRSPVEQSYFDILYNATGSVSRWTFLDPLLKRLGNRSSFEAGALISALAYFIQAQSWRPFGASRLRMAVQYCAGILLLSTLPTTMRDSMRAMVVKQGLEVTDVGRGQLNAAYLLRLRSRFSICLYDLSSI